MPVVNSRELTQLLDGGSNDEICIGQGSFTRQPSGPSYVSECEEDHVERKGPRVRRQRAYRRETYNPRLQSGRRHQYNSESHCPKYGRQDWRHQLPRIEAKFERKLAAMDRQDRARDVEEEPRDEWVDEDNFFVDLMPVYDLFDPFWGELFDTRDDPDLHDYYWNDWDDPHLYDDDRDAWGDSLYLSVPAGCNCMFCRSEQDLGDDYNDFSLVSDHEDIFGGYGDADDDLDIDTPHHAAQSRIPHWHRHLPERKRVVA